jgi:flagellar protein FliO/FliZ
MTGLWAQSVLATVLVLALVGGLAWAARRTGFAALNKRGPMFVETAVALGERRSLVIVAVEGRRLLLGMTPAQVSMLAELGPVPAAADPAPPASSFDRELQKRT